MPVASPYTRILLEGIPVWKTADGTLYYFDSSTPPTPETRICIGTESTGFCSNWKDLLAEALASYRTTATTRARIPGTAAQPA